MQTITESPTYAELHEANLAAAKALGDDGNLDGQFGSLEWRVDSDSDSWDGSWCWRASRITVDGDGEPRVTRGETHGYDTAEEAYESMVELLGLEGQF